MVKGGDGTEPYHRAPRRSAFPAATRLIYAAANRFPGKGVAVRVVWMLTCCLFAVPLSAGEPPAYPAAAALLSRWEAAATGRLPVPAAERLRARHARPDLSEHELHLRADFRGPITAAGLARRFDWTAARDGRTLAGVPVDPLERLCLPEVAVTFGDDGLPAVVRCDTGGAVVTQAVFATPTGRSAARPVRTASLERVPRAFRTPAERLPVEAPRP